MAVYTLANNPELLEMVDLIPNVVYAAPDGEELAMQILKPRWSSGGKGFPLVLFIQGSGWTKPKQFLQLPQLSLLARRGFVIASVTHRSAHTAPAPAFLKDVKAALRFLRAHAADYDIDQERVCALGTSSGANAAMLLAFTADDPAFETEDWAGHSTAVQAVVSCAGPTDIELLIRDREPEKKLPALTCHQDPERMNMISPLQYVKPGLKLPPFLILHGDHDPVVPFEQAELFYDKLIQHGYQADLVRVTNAPHGDSFWSLPLFETIFAFVVSELG